MKMKIFLIVIFMCFILLISYIRLNKQEINYTLLGDKEIFSNNIVSKNFADLIYDEMKENKNFGFYSKDFIKEDIRIIDVINQIQNNEKINNIRIQNILSRTDILLLNIGNNEINYKLSNLDPEENNDRVAYEYLDEVFNDFEELLNIIRKYDKKNIIILGYYNDTNNPNNDKYYEYINKKINNYSNKNNIQFINLQVILNKNEDYITKSTPVYITNEGNLAIFNKIYRKITNMYLHKIY